MCRRRPHQDSWGAEHGEAGALGLGGDYPAGGSIRGAKPPPTPNECRIERKFRETRLYQIAPISTNLILSYIGKHVLGMPRSF